MNLREVGALFLVLLTACSGVPRVAHPQVDAEEAQLAAARYELRVLAPDTSLREPVVVSRQDFQRAMRMLAAEIPPSAQPMETARWLMEGELHADLRAEVDRGRVVRLIPLEDGTPLEAASVADMARGYRELKSFRWGSAFLQGCRFKGRFSGNDFGEWPSSPGEGNIVDCDFSEAHLDASRFLACDVSTLRFPPWPCFTIFDPVPRWRELSSLPWPGDIGPIVMEGCAEDPPSTVALTYSALGLTKRYGTTPEAIKAVLEKLDGVYY